MYLFIFRIGQVLEKCRHFNKLWENSRDSKFYLDMDWQVATLLIITVFFTFAFAQWYYTSKHFIKTNEKRISLLLSESQAKSDPVSND